MVTSSLYARNGASLLLKPLHLCLPHLNEKITPLRRTIYFSSPWLRVLKTPHVSRVISVACSAKQSESEYIKRKKGKTKNHSTVDEFSDEMLDEFEIDRILEEMGLRSLPTKSKFQEQPKDDDEHDLDDEAENSDAIQVENEVESIDAEEGMEEIPIQERVNRLVDRIQGQIAGGSSTRVTMSDISSLFPFKMDKFQRIAIEAYLRGSSVVVSAPTSSGKTLIAESAAASVLASGMRLFYTTPLKALSNQKLRDFRELFGEQNVGLLTGDAAVNREAPLVIMTTEILRNMLYCNLGADGDAGDFFNVAAIVLDEVHYLSDVSRGTVWEESIIYCPKNVQLICLSATVANPDELANWISQVHGPTELITSAYRPVPLKWHFSTKFALSLLFNREGDAINRDLVMRPNKRIDDWMEVEDEFEGFSSNGDSKSKGFGQSRPKRAKIKGRSEGRDMLEWASPEQAKNIRRRQVPRLTDTLAQIRSKDMLPAIWFIFSRRGCDAAVDALSFDADPKRQSLNPRDRYRSGHKVNLLREQESEQVRQIIEELRSQNPEAVRENAIEPLCRGFAAHHAGLLPAWKGMLEDLFSKGLLKVVFATETLAAGLNMPARTTIISSLAKRTGTGISPLTTSSLLQMAGRAGRRGKDKLGHCVVVQTAFEGAPEAVTMLLNGPDPLVSQFTATYGMVLNLLAPRSVTMPILQMGTEISEQDLAASDEVPPVPESGDQSSPDATLARGMNEARSLVEKSFGNFLGNEGVLEAQRKIAEFQREIDHLEGAVVEQLKLDREAFNLSSAATCLNQDLEEYRREKAELKSLEAQVTAGRCSLVEPLLDSSLSSSSSLPVVAVDLENSSNAEFLVHCCSRIGKPPGTNRAEEPSTADPVPVTSDTGVPTVPEPSHGPFEDPLQVPSYYLGFKSGQWYAFPASEVRQLYNRTVPEDLGDSSSPLNSAKAMAEGYSAWEWTKASNGVWVSKGGTGRSPGDIMGTVGSLKGLLEEPEELVLLEQRLQSQRDLLRSLHSRMLCSDGFKQRHALESTAKRRQLRVEKLSKKKKSLEKRVAGIQPTGWKEFVNIVSVLQASGALNSSLTRILPLGATAAVTRGGNELWLAMVLSSIHFVFADVVPGDPKPSLLAAICASLVNESPRSRSETKSNEDISDASEEVQECIDALQPMREQLLDLQMDENVLIPCVLDSGYCGLVEAWSSGVSWKELVKGCSLDEGDLARLLRRTIDLLTQIPHLPHVDLSVRKLARRAAKLMDRPPISELVD